MATTLTKTVTDTAMDGGRIYQKTVAYETASGAYELGAATTGKRWYVLAVHYGITSAHVLKILADATELGRYGFASGAASKDSVNTGGELMTDIGEALNVSCDVDVPVLTVVYTDSASVAWSRG